MQEGEDMTAKGEFAQINKNVLKIDRSYQRPEKEGLRKKRMIAQWRWDLCGTLVVGKRTNCICRSGMILDDTAMRKLKAASWEELITAIRLYKNLKEGTDGGRCQASGILKIANFNRPPRNRINFPQKNSPAGDNACDDSGTGDKA
jgi:hypothetical protein